MKALTSASVIDWNVVGSGKGPGMLVNGTS
jgi:hypothetical protein